MNDIQTVELAMDRKEMGNESLDTSETEAYFLYRYFQARIDLANLKTAFRLHNLKKEKQYAVLALAEGEQSVLQYILTRGTNHYRLSFHGFLRPTLILFLPLPAMLRRKTHSMMLKKPVCCCGRSLPHLHAGFLSDFLQSQAIFLQKKAKLQCFARYLPVRQTV